MQHGERNCNRFGGRWPDDAFRDAEQALPYRLSRVGFLSSRHVAGGGHHLDDQPDQVDGRLERDGADDVPVLRPERRFGLYRGHGVPCDRLVGWYRDTWNNAGSVSLLPVLLPKCAVPGKRRDTSSPRSRSRLSECPRG